MSWHRVLILCALTLTLGAVEPTLVETKRLAESLDELVQQQPSPVYLESGQKVKPAVLPMRLDDIVPVASNMLKIDPRELRELLEDDREKLSNIFYARVLGAIRNKPWRNLLVNGEDLLVELQKANVPLTAIYDTLENFHTELAFASLDSPVRKAPPRR